MRLYIEYNTINNNGFEMLSSVAMRDNLTINNLLLKPHAYGLIVFKNN